MTIESERVAVLEAEMHAHFKADENGFARINSDTTEIKSTLRDMAMDIKAAFERTNARIEDEAAAARLSLNAASLLAHSETERVSLVARAEVKLAMDYAQDAHDRIGDQKNWILTGMVALGLAVIGWLIDRFMGKH